MRCMGIDAGCRRVGIWLGELNPETGEIRTDYAAIKFTTDGIAFWDFPAIVPAFFETMLPYSTISKQVLVTERIVGLMIGAKWSMMQWGHVYLITRPVIKTVLLGTSRGTDKDIRIALQELYPALRHTTRDNKIRGDIWAAIATAHVGVTLLKMQPHYRFQRMQSVIEMLHGDTDPFAISEEHGQE